MYADLIWNNINVLYIQSLRALRYKKQERNNIDVMQYYANLECKCCKHEAIWINQSVISNSFKISS